MIDGSLKVYYNGKTNSVFYPPDWDFDYEVGEMLLEVFEAHTSRISELVDEYFYRDREPNEEYITDAIESIFYEDTELDAVVEWSMAKASFVNSLWIYLGALMEGNEEPQKKVKTVGEFLDVCVEEYDIELVNFRRFFEAIVAKDSGDDSEEVLQVTKSFEEIFRRNHKIQSIGYELIFDEEAEEFMSVYSVSNMLSLLALEYCHLTETNKHIRKCRNCGAYFIPKNRSDTVYCDRISPQDSSKTCKQIGAQVAMRNKLASDECTQAYRKKYQSLNMAYQRADEGNRKHFLERRDSFKNEGQKRKKEVEQGTISVEDFVVWCETYK